jgi:hypothetical protein
MSNGWEARSVREGRKQRIEMVAFKKRDENKKELFLFQQNARLEHTNYHVE